MRTNDASANANPTLEANNDHRQRQIGYGAIAEGMSADPSLSIYRRFGALNARNLLCLQSELTSLEEELSLLDENFNDPQDLEKWAIPRSWYKLHRAGGPHLKLMLKIRGKLEEYNTTLQLQASLLQLAKPERSAVKTLRYFLDDRNAEMVQSERGFLDKNTHDLVALATEKKEPLAGFIVKYFYRLLETREDRARRLGQLQFVSATRVQGLIRFLAVLLSSILPILSIIPLNFVKSQDARLGMIVAFSALCSGGMLLLSDARNGEIIATTAAYAAVQVVFVSGNP